MASALKKIDLRKLELETWPTANEELLPEGERVLFVSRRDAVAAYVKTGNAKEAGKASGFTRQELTRLIRRCTAEDPDGELVGFRGCRPFYRVKRYERGITQGPAVEKGEGTAGLLQAVFRQYPEIETKLEDFALRRGDPLELPPRIGLRDIRKKLLALCREAGIPATSYPLNTEEGGIRSLALWRSRLADTHGRAYISDQFGEAAGRNYDEGREGAKPLVDKHQVWVFDEYTLDTIVSIGVPDKTGEVKWLPMSRFKVISGRRRGSKDIIACRAVLKTEPNTADFLHCIEEAIRPHERRKFRVPGFAYPKQACFASELPGCGWALPSVIMLDNSKVHLSAATRRVITEDLGCTVQYGVVRRPRARGDIENWHSYLANEFRKIASTTGTGPNDTRRNEPEKAAVQLRLQLDHIEQVLELLMAKFNAGPLNALKGKTLIEAFTLWARDDNAVVRCVPEAFRERVSLADLQVKVRIASDVGSGKQPVIRFRHADYIGPKLSTFRSRGREECILVLNENTANVGFLYSSDGTELDRLQARGIWRAPHTLSQRVDFVRLRGKGKIRWPGEDESPVEILREYLAKGAATNKRDALNFARVIKEVKVKELKSPPPSPAIGSTPDAKPARANAADGPKPKRPAVVPTMKSGGNW
jgi:putative transposase